MIPLKKAVEMWESPLKETMLSYHSLLKRARVSPDIVFVYKEWPDCSYQFCDVGLTKVQGRWFVNEEMLKTAIVKKIQAVEHGNLVGATNIPIIYPSWFHHLNRPFGLTI